MIETIEYDEDHPLPKQAITFPNLAKFLFMRCNWIASIHGCGTTTIGGGFMFILIYAGINLLASEVNPINLVGVWLFLGSIGFWIIFWIITRDNFLLWSHIHLTEDALYHQNDELSKNQAEKLM